MVKESACPVETLLAQVSVLRVQGVACKDPPLCLVAPSLLPPVYEAL